MSEPVELRCGMCDGSGVDGPQACWMCDGTRTVVAHLDGQYVAVAALLDRPAQAAAVDWIQRDGDLHETERVVWRVIATAINAVTGTANEEER